MEKQSISEQQHSQHSHTSLCSPWICRNCNARKGLRGTPISSEKCFSQEAKLHFFIQPHQLNLHLQNEYSFLRDFLLLKETFLVVWAFSTTCADFPPRIVAA